MLETDWYGSEQQAGLRYGSFILDPQVIEVNLSKVKITGTI